MSAALFEPSVAKSDAERGKPDTRMMYIHEVLGELPQWWWHQLDCAPESVPDGYVKVKGAVAPLKRDGFRSWRKRDKTTERIHFIRIADVERWESERAESLGICVECWGTKEVWIGWGKYTGHRYKTCPKCKGTGKPAAEAEPSVHGPAVRGR